MRSPGTSPESISAAQSRAARAVLRMTVTDTCQAADVARATLIKFEAGGEIRSAIVKRLQSMFEARGVVFTASGVGLQWEAEIS